MPAPGFETEDGGGRPGSCDARLIPEVMRPTMGVADPEAYCWMDPPTSGLHHIFQT